MDKGQYITVSRLLSILVSLSVNILNPFSDPYIVISGEFWEKLGGGMIFSDVGVCLCRCGVKEMEELEKMPRILAWELMIN